MQFLKERWRRARRCARSTDPLWCDRTSCVVPVQSVRLMNPERHTWMCRRSEKGTRSHIRRHGSQRTAARRECGWSCWPERRRTARSTARCTGRTARGGAGSGSLREYGPQAVAGSSHAQAPDALTQPVPRCDDPGVVQTTSQRSEETPRGQVHQIGAGAAVQVHQIVARAGVQTMQVSMQANTDHRSCGR